MEKGPYATKKNKVIFIGSSAIWLLYCQPIFFGLLFNSISVVIGMIFYLCIPFYRNFVWPNFGQGIYQKIILSDKKFFVTKVAKSKFPWKIYFLLLTIWCVPSIITLVQNNETIFGSYSRILIYVQLITFPISYYICASYMFRFENIMMKYLYMKWNRNIEQYIENLRTQLIEYDEENGKTKKHYLANIYDQHTEMETWAYDVNKKIGKFIGVRILNQLIGPIIFILFASSLQ